MSNYFERPSLPQEPESQQPESQETPTLRFPEIYQSPEWKALDELDRAQLLLVAEGAKPGTIVSGNFTGFQHIVERMGLATHLNSEELHLEPVYEVARPEILDQKYHELVTLPENAPDEEFHRINGRFLGYPPCCTEEYINPKKNRAQITKKYGAKRQEKITNVDYEARQLIESGTPYPEALDYCPPTYTPCSATCAHALATLATWKQLLDYADPEAAAQLVRFNWQSEPYRSAHQIERAQQKEERIKQDKLRFLRKSAGLEDESGTPPT